MGLAGMQWQALQLPFAAGLNQRADDRARPQPFLDICNDVQFDEDGGLQVRFPFGAAAGSIFGGGTIANARRIVQNGTEEVLFTKDAIYSWNAQLSKFVLRGTHMAVAVDERAAFTTPGDQIDGDRAELGGTVMMTWSEGANVFIAANDKTTGSVLLAPVDLSTGSRPRLVATATRILAFFVNGSSALRVGVFDPANPAGGTSSFASLPTLTAAGPYDVTRVDGQDLVVGAAKRSVTTSYAVFTVDAAGGIALLTIARTADGPIAVASAPGGAQTQIVRASGTNIVGDLITTATLADVFINQAIGTAVTTTINQIAAEYATATTAYAFWTSGNVGETAAFTDFLVKYNTVTTAGAIGTQATFRHQLGIASRAFRYDGHVYLWLAFASDSGTSAQGNDTAVRAQLQHTYFLYRDDQLVVSRCVMGAGGGFAASTGRLPGVAPIGVLGTEFAWCATSRRIIAVGAEAAHTAFSARSLRDTRITFDSNEARRCARIGATLYISGGIPLQYDGTALAEVGFLIYPWYFEPTAGGPGNLGAGTYTWKSTLQWPNAQGEVDRSTTATGMSLTVAASKFVFLNYLYLHVTLKTGARPPAIVMWRTSVAPERDSPFYRVSSQDPNAGIVDNGYVANLDTGGTPTPLPDNFVDATLITKELDHEPGDTLEYLAPPGAKIIIATDTRVLLADVAGDPDRVWYSRLRKAGEVASFHETLTTNVPREGGTITSIIVYEDVLFAFRETATYALPGVGRDNTGLGQNYGPARTVSLDVGAVNHESVAITPRGVIFKSRKGWHLLDGAGAVAYIGDRISDSDSEAVLAVHVVETQHQVRILTAARLLVWDYRVNQWGQWTISDGVHACMFGGSYVYLTATGPRTQLTTYTGLTYGLDVETAWIKLADLQGSVSVRKLQPFGEYRSTHHLRMRVAYNYVESYIDDVAWPPSPTTVGGPLQVTHGPKRPKCESIKLRLTAVDSGVTASVAAGDYTPVVETSGILWDAGWVAAAIGELGNAVTMSISFEDGTPFAIEVFDHATWVHADQRWVDDRNNVGVKVTCRTGSSPTVAQLEAAIIAGSGLIEIDTAGTAPTDVIDATAMAGLASIGVFGGGTYGSPSGEALKLTALGLEVGLERGLFRRLPPAQEG